MTPPLNEVTLLSPEIELSEIWGDTIVALFQILEFPWGDSIGALFKNSRSILHISTLQIRFKLAKIFSRLRRDFTLLKWLNRKIFGRLRRHRVDVMYVKRAFLNLDRFF